jgi:hypothetical protein
MLSVIQKMNHYERNKLIKYGIGTCTALGLAYYAYKNYHQAATSKANTEKEHASLHIGLCQEKSKTNRARIIGNLSYSLYLI